MTLDIHLRWFCRTVGKDGPFSKCCWNIWHPHSRTSMHHQLTPICLRFDMIFIKSLPNLCHDAFSLCFLLGVLQFQLLSLGLYLFWVDICACWKKRCDFFFSFFFFICSEFCHMLKWNSHGFTCVYPFACGYPMFPAWFIEETVLSSLYILDNFAKE